MVDPWLEIEQDLKTIIAWEYSKTYFPNIYWRSREELSRGIWSHGRNWSDYEFDQRYNRFLKEAIISLAQFLRK